MRAMQHLRESDILSRPVEPDAPGGKKIIR